MAAVTFTALLALGAESVRRRQGLVTESRSNGMTSRFYLEFCASVESFSCSPPPSVSLPRPASDKHGVKAVHSWICWLFNSTFRHYIKLFCRTSVTEPTPTYAPINAYQPSTSSPTQIQDSSLTQPHGHEYCQFFPTSPSHPTLASKAPPWNEITMLPNQIQRTTDVP